MRHLHCLADIKVVVPLDLFPLGCGGAYWRLQRQRLGERGQSLLAVQNQLLRLLILRDLSFQTLNRSRLKPHLTTSFQQHDGANWKRSGNADQQVPNMIVVPDPAALNPAAESCLHVSPAAGRSARPWCYQRLSYALPIRFVLSIIHRCCSCATIKDSSSKSSSPAMGLVSALVREPVKRLSRSFSSFT